jgi:hypothetical protein
MSDAENAAAMRRRRRVALTLILIVDVGYIAWDAGATASPDHLLGPGGKAILPAGFEGYSGGSWSELARDSSLSAGYMTVLYRMYGVYNVLFGLMSTAIAVTAFRRGDRWAWVDVARRQHDRTRFGHQVRLDRERHRALRAP